jgi:hypothetical protein
MLLNNIKNNSKLIFGKHDLLFRGVQQLINRRLRGYNNLKINSISKFSNKIVPLVLNLIAIKRLSIQ